MKRWPVGLGIALFVQVLGGCSSCGKEEEPVDKVTLPVAAEPSSTTVSLVGPRQHAPALKGIMLDKHADGGMSGK